MIFNFLEDRHRYCQSGSTVLQHLEKTELKILIALHGDNWYTGIIIHAVNYDITKVASILQGLLHVFCGVSNANRNN